MLSVSPHKAADNAAWQLITLSNRQGMSIVLTDWGASWLSALVPLADGTVREALLTSPLSRWQQQTAYLGASVGRYANRIAHSRFLLDGRQIQLQANQGDHQLHGGAQGFDKRRWQIVAQPAQHAPASPAPSSSASSSASSSLSSSQQLLMQLVSPAGDQGFPGELTARVCFTLTEDNCVIIAYQAQVTQPCPVNLTNHAYFNLDGEQTDVRQHRLQLLAQQFLPVDSQGIPTADPLPVAGSSFDFRQAKTIAQDFLADEFQQQTHGYDHGFLLDSAGDISKPACLLSASDQRLQLRVYTNAPALQFYSGNFLHGTPARAGGEYQDWQGLALESGFLADSPNHPHWAQPDCIIRPQQTYCSITRYQFIAG